ncbi:MAG: hypothetical protein SOW25_01820 [Helicobacter sp.]|nr:hypothetical protein [Helicobacter sp.]
MESLLKSKKYLAMQERHCKEIIEILIQKKMNFSIICNVACASFEPELPKEIKDGFNELSLFILAGYTFESLQIDDKNLYFEAGFGEENLGSFVTIPLESIVQIMLPNHNIAQGDFCLYINLLATFAESKNNKSDEKGISDSMRAILANPKNNRFKK